MNRLEKKIGLKQVKALRGLLVKGDFEGVVRGLLRHYDHLYDLHAINGDSHGSKAFTALRHHIVDVVQAFHILPAMHQHRSDAALL